MIKCGSEMMPEIFWYYEGCEDCLYKYTKEIRKPGYLDACYSVIWGQESPDECVVWCT